jgi:hypothetical protein
MKFLGFGLPAKVTLSGRKYGYAPALRFCKAAAYIFFRIILRAMLFCVLTSPKNTTSLYIAPLLSQ